jgi:signal transduction histidine kinase
MSEHDTNDGAGAVPPWADEPVRLAALRRYAVLDTEAEAAFDDIAALARSVCDTPIALVSFVDGARQWFKAADGLSLRQTPLNTSICAHTIAEPVALEVPDTLADPRFARMSVVAERGIRFYAGIPLRTPDGYAIGALCVLDTRPRRLDDAQMRNLGALARQVMAQLELRRTLGLSEQAVHAHRRIMAVAGHDLGNPLMRIELALHQFASLPGLDAETREQLALARDAQREIGDTLRRLAEASMLDRQNIAIERVELAGVLADVDARWRRIFANAGRTLVLEPAPGSVESDAALIRNVLDNLIGNALKHAPSGAVTVSCGNDERGAWFAVADTGPGIADVHQQRIFEAFAQVGDNRHGLGLGLSIVQRTAALLGADVSVHSAPRHGARFVLRLPPRG